MNEGNWLSKSKRTYGDCNGGGSKGRATSAPKAGMGKKDGGKSGPTEYGDTSGGGRVKSPRGVKGGVGKVNAPKGIGLRKKG